MTELPWFLTNPDPTIYLKSNNYVVLDFETTAKDYGTALDPANRMLIGTWLQVGGPRSEEHRERVGAVSAAVPSAAVVRACVGRSVPAKSAIGGPEQRQLDAEGNKTLDDVQVCSGSSYTDIRALIDAVERADFIVAHNAKFELQWLSRLGCDIGRLLVYDTLLGEYVRLGNRKGRKDLDTVLRRYGIKGKIGLVKSLIAGGVCPSEIPANWLKEYGCYDTYSTYLAFLSQRAELHSLDLIHILYTRCIATPVLADIESRGICPDPKRVRAELDRTISRLQELGRSLEVHGPVNWNSSKQLGVLLYDTLGFQERKDYRGEPIRTSGGNRATSADVIGRLVATSELQRSFLSTFLEYRKLSKSLEILDKLQACIDDGGILYAQYNQAATGTHRLSSAGRKHKLQFQNLPREFKRLFRARHPGWIAAEADGAQLEFRVGAHLGRDTQALADIRSGFDIHRNTASVLNLVPLERVTKSQRQDAKPLTFKPLYGGRSGTPREKAYYDSFRKRYKGIFDTQTGWTYDVLRTGELLTEWGLRFYWPGVKQSRSGYIDHSTKIFNYPVQSLATAEIIPIALVFTWHLMRLQNNRGAIGSAEVGPAEKGVPLHGMRGYLVNTIHDSVVAEIPADEYEAFVSITKEAFTSRVYGYLSAVYGVRFTVPLGVEVKAGEFWGEVAEGRDCTFNLEPPSGG